MNAAGRIALVGAGIGVASTMAFVLGSQGHRPLDGDPSLGVPGLLFASTMATASFGVGTLHVELGGGSPAARAAGAVGLAAAGAAYALGLSRADD